eukprot:TRINITY_DN7235_c0_g1_i1.p2 TRINITY_DN7235_c0_g1~~TRINITY_DN7235_c0_g1_i1.p2  ORF type:complete len:198 (-),score=55.81 TRINITY_DN7235_c0_g1_i1:36-629(-)
MDFLNSALKAGKAAVLNTPEWEMKVMEVTDNKPWGPSSTDMQVVADATNRFSEFPIIMGAIWKRLNDRDPSKWRHIYKAVTLLDYLVRNATDQVASEARVHMMTLQALSNFHHTSSDGKDVGFGIREKSKRLVELLHDERKLMDERRAAQKNKSKFSAAMSSDGAHHGATGGGGGGRYTGFGSDSFRQGGGGGGSSG